MVCKDNVVFKSVTKINGGSFTNDTGEVITYDTYYRLIVDINNNGNIKEVRLKFPISNNLLFEKLKDLNPYTPITLSFQVVIYNNGCRVIPFDIVK